MLEIIFFTLYAVRAMDAHPVPQNVTQFQFKLIGDMNLKQFGYLGSGVGFAYLMFVFVAGAAPIIAWPIIVVSSFLGIAFAFLPIQDRPLDHWVSAFLKAIYSPTSRVWKKNNKSYKEDLTFRNRLSLYLAMQKNLSHQAFMTAPLPNVPSSPPTNSVPTAAETPASVATPNPIDVPTTPMTTTPLPGSIPTLATFPQASHQPVSISTQPATPNQSQLTELTNQISRALNLPFQHPTPAAPKAAPNLPQPILQLPVDAPQPQLPSSEELSKTVNLGREAQTLQLKIIEAEKQLAQIKAQAAQGGNPAEYTAQFNQIFTNLQNLVKEASNTKGQLETLTKEPANPVKPVVKVEVVKSRPQPTPITLTSTPNVISGIVVDGEGNYLESVVVVIHDKDGLPVRALKTNKLGQFTGSTPLANGTFNIELEKDNYVFDIQQIELNGKVIPPLMISAKTGVATI